MISIKRFAVALLSVVGLASQAQVTAPHKSEAEAMRELRLRALSVSAKDIGISPTKEFPRTYAVLIDFPIAEFTATIVSLSNGNASLYTTSTFGVIGGEAHEKVKIAATNLVAASDKFYEEAQPTKDYRYPTQNKMRFYFVSFGGVRVIEAEMSAIESNKSKYSSLFWLGQEVMAQLRLATKIK